MQARDINQQYWRHEELPHFELRSTFQSSQPYKAHSHTELSIGAVISGGTRLTFGDHEQWLEEGDVVVIEPDRVHACNPAEGIQRSYHMLYVDTRWCLDKLSRLYSRPVERMTCDQVVIQIPELYGLFLTLIAQLQSNDLPGAELAFDQLAYQVLSNWCAPSQAKTEEDGLAHRVRRRLLSDMVQVPSLDTLADELNRSKEGLIRQFSRQFGITPKAFLNNARIEKSKLYLREGLSIVDASMAVGFSDQSQFHRAFVAYTASTPRQYQQAGSISDNIS